MKSEGQTLSLKCKHCNKEFKYESEKRRHEQSHEPQFECKLCSKKFSFLSALRRHEKQHERKESVTCDECERSFRDDILLKRHIEYAHKGTHKCIKCNSTYHSETALRTHMKTHRPVEERKYRCSFDGCNKTFNFAHHLKHHLLTHTDDKPHICKECGKRFIQLHHLKVHQRSHRPDSWLCCSELGCDKEFTNEYALRRHTATHKSQRKRRYPVHSVHPDRSIEQLQGSITDVLNPQDIITDYYLREGDLDKAFVSKEVLENVPDKTVIGIEESLKVNCIPADVIETNKHDSPTSISNCKSILGQCIVSGDSEANEACLCDQIDANQNVKTSVAKIAFSNEDIGIQLKNDPKCIEKRLYDANACEKCECASICGIKNNTNASDPRPEFVYQTGGVIKLKDAFDVDLNFVPAGIENDIYNSKLKFGVNSVPISSCRDVLGKCIVGGNGTIGEGCLCARMAADDQQGSTQEIEEITPCPEGNSML